MADDSTITTNRTVTPTAAETTRTTTATATNKPAANNKEIGSEQFLTLLVNQLQHQDPMNPMDNQEFAVQLAQFSSLEQLTQINEKLEALGGGSSSVSTMASYLGNEVVLKDAKFELANGQSSNIYVNIPEGTQSLRVDLLDDSGQVVARQNVENFETGQQVLKGLNDFAVADGEYDVRVVSVDQEGSFVDLDGKVTGTVDGFVVEPEPMLLVGGKEVSVDDVVEVHRSNS